MREFGATPGASTSRAHYGVLTLLQVSRFTLNGDMVSLRFLSPELVLAGVTLRTAAALRSQWRPCGLTWGQRRRKP